MIRSPLRSPAQPTFFKTVIVTNQYLLVFMFPYVFTCRKTLYHNAIFFKKKTVAVIYVAK